MRKRNKTIILMVIAVVTMLIASCSIAVAASATVSVSGGSVNKGETVTVNITYSGANYGTAAADITYDKSYLQFESCSATYGGGSGKITVSMVDVNKNSLSCSIKFKALKAGSTSVSVIPVEAYDMSGEELTASAKSATVTVKDPSTAASSNANLSSLKVSSGSLSPAFSSGTTSYNVKVSNDVTSCTLSVKTADSKATYTISGASSLSVGKNVRKVTVTAENGTTKTYTITITRAEKSQSSSGNQDNDKPQDDEESEENSEKQLETTIGNKEYIICENLDNKDIPQGFTITVAQYKDKEIPVFKDVELKYTVALLKNKETGEENWFFYDEEKDTFSATTALTTEDIIEYEELKTAIGDNFMQGKVKATDQVLFIALGGTVVLLLGAVLIMQYIILKGRKK